MNQPQKKQVYVHVIGGPHKGLNGHVIDTDKDGNVVVAVNLNGKIIWITVDYQHIERSKIFFH